ncbi:MAG: cbbA, partial [Caulobacteraceae bacterium]|nr:cbbA [Caulobacteraceae bacterium]
EELVRGIKHGVRKINIDTDLRLAAMATIRRIADQNPEEFDPRSFFKPSMDAITSICKERFEAFGTAGNASKIRPIPLSEMAKRYASGELDPRIVSARVAAE